jgi:hypothetical protein
VIDQGWEIDDYDDEDYWDDDPFDDYEPSEPDCWCSDVHDCWTCYPQPLRVRRRLARRWRMEQQRRRKLLRHANDRFWQVRNRPAFDGEAPF